MITLIHGNDVVNSRNFFLSQRDKHTDKYDLQVDEVEINILTQILEGGGLFSQNKNLFIESFLTQKKKGNEKDTLIKYLLKSSKEHNIFLWEGQELTQSTLTPFKTGVIRIFKLPSTLFEFLDSVKPGTGKNLVKKFHDVLKYSETDLIFAMLIRQMRLLIAISDSSGENISEIKRTLPWQRSKLIKQAELFGIEKLKMLYRDLYNIEKAQKKGAIALSKISTIDFFLLGI